MSKGLEALHKLLFDKSLDKILTVEEEANLIYTIKTELKRLEKQDEVLRIIKEKKIDIGVNIGSVIADEPIERQIIIYGVDEIEFDLLKEYLK